MGWVMFCRGMAGGFDYAEVACGRRLQRRRWLFFFSLGGDGRRERFLSFFLAGFSCVRYADGRERERR